MSKNMQMKKETGKISHRKFLSENIGLSWIIHGVAVKVAESHIVTVF